jgi:hypothetical protein
MTLNWGKWCQTIKIVNEEYVNLGLLVKTLYGADPNYDTKYTSLQNDTLTDTF